MRLHYFGGRINIQKEFGMKLLKFIIVVIMTMGGFWYLESMAQVTTPSELAPIKKVEIIINTPDYQVAYLSDFIDVRQQKLSPSVANVSVDIDVVDPAGKSGIISLEAEILVQLQGDKQTEVLVKGRTNRFVVPNGHRTLSARDFASKALTQEIRILGDEFYYENTSLRKRLEDRAQTTLTIPPGTYKIVLRAKNILNNVVGVGEKTIVISRSNVEEVVVEIIEPKNGSTVTTLTPTFSWTTTANDVIVRIFEAGRSHRSAQDATAGARPFLTRTLTGVTTMTYPADAERKLEEGKAYVVQVSALISTNRGVVERPGKPVVFRVSGDRVGMILDKFFSTQPSDIAAVYSTLRSEQTQWIPWKNYGAITLDGKIIGEEELEQLLQKLSQQQDLKPSISIENQ